MAVRTRGVRNFSSGERAKAADELRYYEMSPTIRGSIGSTPNWWLGAIAAISLASEGVRVQLDDDILPCSISPISKRDFEAESSPMRRVPELLATGGHTRCSNRHIIVEYVYHFGNCR